MTVKARVIFTVNVLLLGSFKFGVEGGLELSCMGCTTKEQMIKEAVFAIIRHYLKDSYFADLVGDGKLDKEEYQTNDRALALQRHLKNMQDLVSAANKEKTMAAVHKRIYDSALELRKLPQADTAAKFLQKRDLSDAKDPETFMKMQSDVFKEMYRSKLGGLYKAVPKFCARNQCEEGENSPLCIPNLAEEPISKEDFDLDSFLCHIYSLSYDKGISKLRGKERNEESQDAATEALAARAANPKAKAAYEYDASFPPLGLSALLSSAADFEGEESLLELDANVGAVRHQLVPTSVDALGTQLERRRKRRRFLCFGLCVGGIILLSTILVGGSAATAVAIASSGGESADQPVTSNEELRDLMISLSNMEHDEMSPDEYWQDLNYVQLTPPPSVASTALYPKSFVGVVPRLFSMVQEDMNDLAGLPPVKGRERVEFKDGDGTTHVFKYIKDGSKDKQPVITWKIKAKGQAPEHHKTYTMDGEHSKQLKYSRDGDLHTLDWSTCANGYLSLSAEDWSCPYVTVTVPTSVMSSITWFFVWIQEDATTKKYWGMNPTLIQWAQEEGPNGWKASPGFANGKPKDLDPQQLTAFKDMVQEFAQHYVEDAFVPFPPKFTSLKGSTKFKIKPEDYEKHWTHLYNIGGQGAAWHLLVWCDEPVAKPKTAWASNANYADPEVCNEPQFEIVTREQEGEEEETGDEQWVAVDITDVVSTSFESVQDGLKPNREKQNVKLKVKAFLGASAGKKLTIPLGETKIKINAHAGKGFIWELMPGATADLESAVASTEQWVGGSLSYKWNNKKDTLTLSVRRTTSDSDTDTPTLGVTLSHSGELEGSDELACQVNDMQPERGPEKSMFEKDFSAALTVLKTCRDLATNAQRAFQQGDNFENTMKKLGENLQEIMGKTAVNSIKSAATSWISAGAKKLLANIKFPVKVTGKQRSKSHAFTVKVAGPPKELQYTFGATVSIIEQSQMSANIDAITTLLGFPHAPALDVKYSEASTETCSLTGDDLKAAIAKKNIPKLNIQVPSGLPKITWPSDAVKFDFTQV